MNYTSIEKFLENDLIDIDSYLFICDNKLQENLLNKIVSKGFNKNQILSYDDLLKEIDSKMFSDNKEEQLSLFQENIKSISHIETAIIIEKIISKNSELKFLENQPSSVSGFIEIINNMRLFPYYDQEIPENIKDKVQLILKLYKAECKKNNLMDYIDRLIEFSKSNIPVRNKVKNIIILGDFFYLSQLHWQVLQNLCSKYQTVFIGSISEHIRSFFSDKDFVIFQNKLKSFFHSGSQGSLYNYLETFKAKASQLNYLTFSDWEDEINHIAYQIRNDVSENKIEYSEIGIYLPSKIYNFKIEKIFHDFSIPHYTTFTKALSELPLSKFISFYLEMDWSDLKDVFKFLNSSFIRIDYSDFKITDITEQFFLDIDLNTVELTIENFEVKIFQEILNQSGIENFFYQDVTLRKLKNYFEKEAKFSLDNINKVAVRYKTALIYLEYFQNKIKELKAVMPNTIYPNAFMNYFNHALEFFRIKDIYVLENNDQDESIKEENIGYQAFINFWQDLTEKLEKVNYRKHSQADYSRFYKKFASGIFFNTSKDENGVMITDLPFIASSGLKRVYQVGMSNKYFPAQPGNDIFTAQSQKINPISQRDVQLFTFVELLKQFDEKHIELIFSMPKLIAKEDNEPSELLVDLEIKGLDMKLIDNEKIFSHSDKCKLVAKTLETEELSYLRLKEIYKHRKLNKEWTKFEGHLEDIFDTQTFERQTSITQVEEFAACPMKFFFNRKLKLAAKKEKRNDIEANIKGDIIHKILESYYRKLISEYSIHADIEIKQKLALEISNDTFKNFEQIYDNLYLDNLKYKMNTGLKGEIKKGILYKVLETDQERIDNGWLPTEFEYKFKYEIEDFKFTGSIDRIDVNGNNFQIIDYKTGGFKTVDDIKEGLSFQLPVYAIAYSDKTGSELDSAGYYALKDIEDIKTELIIPEIKGRGKNKVVETDNQTILETTLKHLANLKSFMKNSKYNFTVNDPEKVCSYCDFTTACHYDSQKVFTLQQDNEPKQETIINVLDGDKFSYHVKFLSSQSGLTDEQKSALATDKNIIVTAGAGAGKTEVLTNRMLNLLEKTEGKIDKILVITFTKKATAEMQYRIYSSIVKKIVSGEDDKGYYLDAKLNFAKNWISTIDGFYMRILKENSLELELEQEFKIAEPQELKQLIVQTIEKKIDDLASERNEHLEKLLHVWTRKQIIEHCETLLNKPWIYDFLKLENYDDLVKAYQEIFISDANKAIEIIDGILKDSDYTEANNFPKDSINALLNCKHELVRFIDNFPDTYNPPNLDADFKLARKPPKFPDKDKYDQAKEAANLLPKIIEEYKMANIEKDCLIALIQILKVVEKIYQEKRKKDNINNFSDISVELYNLLKANKNGIREKLKDKFSYIMIDEFQDTDLMQWEIAKYLAGWNGEDYSTMSSDRLFIVGDDKQSIYGFRGGDVQVFNSAREEILQINHLNSNEGGFIQFPDNFRSSANIIDFFNKFFYTLFGFSEKKYEARHQNLKGHKQKGSINFFLFNKGKPEDKRNENTEPAFVAHQIKEILNSNPLENIAILFRTKSKIDSFARELEKLEINYIISGGRGFYETREIMDLYNILTFLADEQRKIELIGFLRSPMAGLSDTEIYHIKENLVKGLENYPEIYNLIYGIYENDKLVKKGWKQDICELNIHELVIKIIFETNYKASIYHDADALQKIKNIEKFIEIAKEKEDMTLDEFVEFLEYQLKNNTDEANATILELGKKQPVQLMTIHASKGLGFDTVIIADSGSAGKMVGAGETLYFGEIEDIPGNHIGFKVPAPDSFKKVDTSIKNKIIDMRRNKEEAELKRLLYVALTRVKHNLIITGSVKATGFSKSTFMEFFSRHFSELESYLSFDGSNVFPLLEGVKFHIYNEDCKVTSPNPLQRVT